MSAVLTSRTGDGAEEAPPPVGPSSGTWSRDRGVAVGSKPLPPARCSSAWVDASRDLGAAMAGKRSDFRQERILDWERAIAEYEGESGSFAG